jgi:hypothetical protein
MTIEELISHVIRKTHDDLFITIRILSNHEKTRIDLFRVFRSTELNEFEFRFSRKNDFYTLISLK